MEYAAKTLKEYAEQRAAACVLEERTKVSSCLDPNNYWQRPVENHIVEFIVINALAVSAGIVGWAWMKHEGRVGMDRDRRYGRVFGWFIAALLTFFFCMQVFYKTIRDTGHLEFFGLQIPRALAWMVMPCHIYTLTSIAALVTPKPLCNYLASMCVTAAWNTILGSAFADFDDQTHWSEAYVFIAHHAVLNLLPLYFATSFPLHKFTFGWLAFSSCWITLLNMGVETPLSYVSGYNINYHLRPPSKGLPDRVFGADIYYKPKIVLILVLLSTSSHLLVSFFARFFVKQSHSKNE